ncbi:uncharacterized protein HMPREF1541_10050 [Cyphellophora europaea CBS 101466]|uniref:Uncharacterized protein n=1 Tax=Cyphellophora europaea (strain CBS 101466) TaxID=1220924 RepID=W2SAX1_CYPE1|nr:uncharacterized protein HMPREF1541_10050 [Cyphellophora europaea CBS 101466]ETN45173.1 hypothetical protein HMPREF1541_10050 [Cyphellophora europaea CBS 101466]
MAPVHLYLFSTLATLSGLVHAAPPFTGPLLPPPNLTSSEHFAEVTANLTALLNDALADDTSAGFAVNTTSFSVAVTSLHAPASSSVLWDYHHLAPNRSANSTANLTGDSTYLIASISKVFTSLLVQQANLPLSNPITTYLPELNGPSNTTIPWTSITLHHLLTHLSGLPQTYGFPEVYSPALTSLYTTLGFPPLDPSSDDYPPCGIIGLNPGCNATTLPAALLQTAEPIAPPGHTPTYGSLSFSLLGLALERATNTTFADLLHAHILGPLGMGASGLSGSSPPSEDDTPAADAVIPTGESSFNSAFGINNPASGLVSSSNDLARFLRAILSSSSSADADADADADDADADADADDADDAGKILPSQAAVRDWLKPAAFLPTGGGNAVGAPWEIYRVGAGVVTSEASGQGVELYAKDGSVLGYYSRVVLVPSVGVGVVVLTAGEAGARATAALQAVSEAVVARVVSGAEAVARLQARGVYEGEYVLESGEVEVEGNATLRVAEDGPGVRVQGLFRNGSDVLEAIQTIFAQSVVGGGVLSDEWRIYPAGVEERVVEGDGEEVVLEDWRLGIEPVTEEAKGVLAEAGHGVFKEADSAWLRVDGTIVYGGKSLDRFVFVKGQGGEIRGLRVPALRMELTKQ